jgi:hypothetical protein
MNAPFTPFEQVFAVLTYLTNLPDSLQKSTQEWQEWMDETRKNLAALSEQIAEGMAEYEKTETEAFAVLTRGGWLSMERHLTGPQVRTVLDIAQARGDDAANRAIANYFAKDDWALVTAMSDEWLDIPYFKDREPIVRDGIAAHRSGKFTLSVPALLPLAEGLAADIVGPIPAKKGTKIENAVKKVARDWKAREQELWTQLCVDVVIGVMYKNVDFANKPPYLNRHFILHGRMPNYATDLTSLRVILLADSVSHLWREKQKQAKP